MCLVLQDVQGLGKSLKVCEPLLDYIMLCFMIGLTLKCVLGRNAKPLVRRDQRIQGGFLLVP